MEASYPTPAVRYVTQCRGLLDTGRRRRERARHPTCMKAANKEKEQARVAAALASPRTALSPRPVQSVV